MFISVLKKPGAMALTVTPLGASSTAMARGEGVEAGLGGGIGRHGRARQLPMIEVVMMMRPCFFGSHHLAGLARGDEAGGQVGGDDVLKSAVG